MKINQLPLAGVIAFALNMAAMAQSQAGIEGAPTGTTRNDSYEWGAGFGFYTPSGVGTTINALGFWDQSGTGLQEAHTVALYQYSGSGSSYNLMDSVTVQAGTVDPLIDGYRWVSIGNLALPDIGQGGNYYIILASQGGDTWTTMSGQTLNPAIGTFSSGALIDNDSGEDLSPTPPSSFASVDGLNSGYGGGNLAYLAAVPEPATFSLLGGGFMLFMAARRKK
jgi:hypothetical protein